MIIWKVTFSQNLLQRRKTVFVPHPQRCSGNNKTQYPAHGRTLELIAPHDSIQLQILLLDGTLGLNAQLIAFQRKSN